MQTQSNSSSVDQLNSFLRGERSAVETYKQALSKLDSSSFRPTLEQCARSHEERVRLLAEEVRRRGGQPSGDSGAWGSFAKLIEGSAAVFGEKAAVSALEEGEDHGRNDYQRDLDELDVSARQLVQSQLLPEQLRTHDAVSSIKKSL